MVFVCWVEWRSGNKPSALLFPLWAARKRVRCVPKRRTFICQGNGRLFFQPSELPLSFPETHCVLGSFVL